MDLPPPLPSTSSVHEVSIDVPSSKANTLVDAFLFYNEIELLSYRLHLLDPIVDFFVIVESTHTFAGKPKPLFYQENQSMFTKFHSKIIHVIVDDLPYQYPAIQHEANEQWQNEYFQRNAISRGIAKTTSDWILITDVDEIPDPRTLTQWMSSSPNPGAYSLEMDMYYYNLYTQCQGKWTLGKLVSRSAYHGEVEQCQTIRTNPAPCIPNSGWHLSYFGDGAFIQNKLSAFSHQDLNVPQYNDISKIEAHIRNRTDLFERVGNQYHSPTVLPYQYERHLSRFY